MKTKEYHRKKQWYHEKKFKELDELSQAYKYPKKVIAPRNERHEEALAEDGQKHWELPQQ